MKKLNVFHELAVCVLFSIIVLESCDCHPNEIIQVVDIGQNVCISKDTIKDGDVVYLSNGSIIIDVNGDIVISISQENSTYSDGKEKGIPKVSYYIDNKYVGSSNDKSKRFACKYVVSDLSADEHTLSAIPEPQEKGTEFVGGYKSTTFTVEAN